MSVTRVPLINKQLEEIRDAILHTGAVIANAAELDEMFQVMIDGTNTTKTFRHWWAIAREQDSKSADTTEQNRYHTLDRWFKLLGEAWSGKYYTLRGSDYRQNTTGVTTLTPMGDLAGRSAAACATEQSANDIDWADEDPMTWYIRFNGLSLSDGTMNVLAVECVDDTFDITGNTAPVYTGRLGLFRRWYTDGTYEYKTFTTKYETGFTPWAADVAPADNSHRHMSWQATFGGSKYGDKLTSGSGYNGLEWSRNGNTPAWRVSAADGLTAARKWNAYEGTYSDTDLDVILDLWQLRHFDLENSRIIEGCLAYNYQYQVAVAESDVKSVVITTAQAANLVEGSCVEVGAHASGNTDRNTAGMYDLVACAVITQIEEVSIDGTTYARIHLDIASNITVPATAYISTMPWVPGSTEHLPGHKDGALYSCTDGKTPARIAGVEIIDGAYAVGLDPLWNSDWDSTRTPKSIYTVYACRNSENQASSTTNYTSVGTFTGPNSGWQYIKHLQIRTDGMIVPEDAGAANTSDSKWMKSAFYFADSSGVRAPWRFCALTGGGYGGLTGATGGTTPSDALWTERPRLSGSGKKRGEWAA